MKTLMLMAALAVAPSLADHPRTYLASIDGVTLKSGEYVSGFSLDTWGVGFSAVCHIPPGWRVTAGGGATPEGVLSGTGGEGATFLDARRLSQLHGLALVTLVAPVQRDDIQDGTGVIPATFAGHLDVGVYGEDEGERRISLTGDNITLVPAKACPKP